jgi:hypothetical protein
MMEVKLIAFSLPIHIRGSVQGATSGTYSNLFTAGGGSSSVWGCAVKVSGGIDCFLPSDSYVNDGEIPGKGTLSGAAQAVYGDVL